MFLAYGGEEHLSNGIDIVVLARRVGFEREIICEAWIGRNDSIRL